MSIIQISNLTFGYEGSFDLIFEDVSFQFDTNWKLGLIGRNGRGKTTFLKLLMEEYPYSGKISSSVTFDYFPFVVSDPMADTLQVVQEICPDAQLWEVNRELSLLSADSELLYRPFDTLSGGEQVKVLLAGLFLKPNNFLLIDEPTNHLDAQARETVGNYLQSKSGFLLVSHDRAFLDGCIDHVISINRLNIELQRGNFSSWQLNKERQDAFERGENDKLKKDIKRLSEAARRSSDWSTQIESTKKGTRIAGLRPDRGFIGRKAADMMKRSKSIEARQNKAIDEKSKLLKNIELADTLKLHPLGYPKNQLLTLEDISISYGEKPICSGVNLAVAQGDRVSVTGKNGSGKSSILKLILGQDIPHTGTVRAGSGLVISYVSQDTSFLKGRLREYAREQKIDESLFKAILRKLAFDRVQLEKDMADFSEGQKKKVLLAGSLCQQAHLYIWDEPLNFIDVLSRIQIEQLIQQSAPTMLFVEHDRQFVEKIATKYIDI